MLLAPSASQDQALTPIRKEKASTSCSAGVFSNRGWRINRWLRRRSYSASIPAETSPSSLR